MTRQDPADVDPPPRGALLRFGTLRLRHEGAVTSLAYSPDGKLLASCGHDRTARIWDAATGRRLVSVEAHRGRMNAVAFSPDGKRIATAGQDRTVRVWDAATGLE